MLNCDKPILFRVVSAVCLTYVVLTANAALAQKRDRPVPIAAEVYQPTAFPDRVMLTFAGDPAHTQAVTWRTDGTVANAQGQVALADHGAQFESQARSVPAATVPLVTKAGEARCHSVVFEGLEPRTRYLYRVGDGTHWSEWAAFQTAAIGPEPFRFLYLGDAQDSIKSHWSRVIRAAFASARMLASLFTPATWSAAVATTATGGNGFRQPAGSTR